MNDDSAPSGLTSELEARIVALLLGEASDFERDELERLIDERVDVRNFRNQMRAVYGLLEHAAGDAPLDVGMEFADGENFTEKFQEEWKLSETKRSTVLALFAGQKVEEKDAGSDSSDSDSIDLDSIDLDFEDDSLQGTAGHGVRMSSGAAVRKPLVPETSLGQEPSEMLHTGVVQLLLNHRMWVTAASLLLLVSFASFWLYSSQRYVAMGSRISMDSSSLEMPSAAQPPMTAKPSDSASGGMEARFGRSEPASGAKAEAHKVEDLPYQEMAESESLEQSIDRDFDAEVDDAEVEIEKSMLRGRNQERISDGKDRFGGVGVTDLYLNGRLQQADGQEEQAEPEPSSAPRPSAASSPSSGVEMLKRQSATTRGRAEFSNGDQLYSETEALNRESPFASERGQAEQRNQSVLKSQSSANGVVHGALPGGMAMDGGGMGGGGTGGGGMGGGGGFFGGTVGGIGGMIEAEDAAGKSEVSGLSTGERLSVEETFGDRFKQQEQQQGQQQASEQALGKGLRENQLRDEAKKASAEDNSLDGLSDELKVKRKSVPNSELSKGFPALGRPSAGVNGPGPGVLDFADGDEGVAGTLQGFDKRVSGLGANVAGGRQPNTSNVLADDDALADDEREIDKIAKLDAKKEKIELNDSFLKKSGPTKDTAKKRKLGVREEEKTLQASVPLEFPEIDANENGFSTFSLHVSDVSFKLAQAALSKGEWPDASRVRSEEFLNAFNYGDPMPTQDERVSCRVEQSIHPFLQQRNLLRVAMRTAAAGRSSSTPLKLTLVLDNSGSMERVDRQQTVRRAFAVLAQQLKPIDEVTLISFARQPRLLADRISGSEAGTLVRTIDSLPSEGGTNLEAALGLAFEKAQEQYQETVQNRIILLTDGAVNLGDASPKRLSEMIVTMRNRGIAFDAAGISADGLNDEILEALTRKGDGRYYLLDSMESVEDGFAKQIAGALRPAAKNVKIQVEFNPQRVGKYKLLGFEKHRLKREDFRNDKVDAAEMAAAEAGVALYQVQAKPDGFGDIGTVSIRFRDLDTGEMVEELWPIPYETNALRPDLASDSMKIATVASLFATKLKGDAMADTIDLKELAKLLSALPPEIRSLQRIKKLELMIRQARQISGG